MPQWPGVVLIALAILQIVFGAAIEYGQRRERGPVAMAPTLHHALGASLFASLGFAELALAKSAFVRWWFAPVAFVFTLAVGVAAIVAAGRHAER
jgi:hypothetical protein